VGEHRRGDARVVVDDLALDYILTD
jgi:hypothetical protein